MRHDPDTIVVFLRKTLWNMDNILLWYLLLYTWYIYLHFHWPIHIFLFEIHPVCITLFPKQWQDIQEDDPFETLLDDNYRNKIAETEADLPNMPLGESNEVSFTSSHLFYRYHYYCYFVHITVHKVLEVCWRLDTCGKLLVLSTKWDARYMWFLINLTSGLITTNSAWILLSVKPSKYVSKITSHLMPSWALREFHWALYLKLRFLENGFRMTYNGIRILMRAPRKPIKNCLFSSCSRGWIQWWWALVCLQMLDQLLNMLMLFGLPLSLLHRGKFLSTYKNASAEPFWTALHYIYADSVHGDLWAWVSCWYEGGSLS